MSNVNLNRISNLFTQAELDDMAVNHEAVMDVLKPKTLALTEDELKTLNSVAVDNFVFVKQTLTQTDKDGVGLLPPQLAAMVPEFSKDVAFMEQLDAQEAAVTHLLTRIQHTRRVVAHESYNVANSIYLQYQASAAMGIPGAASRYNNLKERYGKGNGGRADEPEV